MEEQNQDDKARTWKGMVWGVFLILLGTAFLLDRIGTLELPHIGHLWPVVFFVIGTGQIVERRFGSSVFMFALGLWFFACNENWMGLDYGNSWPLMMVAIGLSIVFKALTREDERRRRRRNWVDVGVIDVGARRRRSREESQPEEVGHDA